jgi:hypothetical protein
VNKTVNIAAQMPDLVKALTGMDLIKLIGKVQNEDGTILKSTKKDED